MNHREAMPRPTATRGIINEASTVATSYFGVETLSNSLNRDLREATISILAILAIQTIRPVAIELTKRNTSRI